MPQVPYKPIPEPGPSDRRVPTLGIPVTGEAFGTGIGGAIKGFGQETIGYGQQVRGLGEAEMALGRTLGQVGGDAADIALKYQQLNNETWAKNNDVKVMTQIGAEKAKFDQLEGNNAVTALPAFQARIQQIRQNALDNAPNVEARRMLDNSVARRVGFALVDAGGRAGQQAKVAANNAASARLQMTVDNFDLSDPNEAHFNLKHIREETISLGETHGAEADTVNEGIQKNQSRAVLNGIKRMAPKNPEQARKYYDDYQEHMTAVDREQAENVVMRSEATKGARTDADILLRGGSVAGVKLDPFDPSKGPGQLQRFMDAAREVADKKGKENPDYAHNLEVRVRSEVNLGLAGYRDTQLSNKFAVEQFVQGKDEGGKVVNMDAINGPNADPAVHAAFDSLNPDNKKAIERYVASQNKIAIPYTPERQARFQTLMGMSHEHPEEFIQLSLLNEDLPRGKIDELFKKQLSIKDKTAENTDIQRYLGMARPVLDTIGVGPSKTDTAKADQYLNFIGALEVRTNAFKQQYGKPPNYKDIQSITQDLIKEVVTKPGTFWNTRERKFEVEVPEADQEAIRKAYIKVHNREPSLDEIRSEYVTAKGFK